MSCPDRLSSWKQEVSSTFAHLSKAQVLGLVYWSVGIALIGSSGISQISALLAHILKQKEATVFQRLREWYLEAEQKAGDHRCELDVTSCFGPLLDYPTVGQPGKTAGPGTGCHYPIYTKARAGKAPARITLLPLDLTQAVVEPLYQLLDKHRFAPSKDAIDKRKRFIAIGFYLFRCVDMHIHLDQGVRQEWLQDICPMHWRKFSLLDNEDVQVTLAGCRTLCV